VEVSLQLDQKCGEGGEGKGKHASFQIFDLQIWDAHKGRWLIVEGEARMVYGEGKGDEPALVGHPLFRQRSAAVSKVHAETPRKMGQKERIDWGGINGRTKGKKG